MARVKRGTTKNKRRKNILSQVKGHRFGYSTKERIAKEAIRHAGTHAFRHRRTKKRDFKQLWTLRINAALHENGLPSFSKFMGTLRKKGIMLDKKSLGTLAMNHPESFVRIAKSL
ncbi:50S ribosomal protein L20 [bacterium]|nr:50S ribosomal protein L20 [bacterium]